MPLYFTQLSNDLAYRSIENISLTKAGLDQVHSQSSLSWKCFYHLFRTQIDSAEVRLDNNWERVASALEWTDRSYTPNTDVKQIVIQSIRTQIIIILQWTLLLWRSYTFFFIKRHIMLLTYTVKTFKTKSYILRDRFNSLYSDFYCFHRIFFAAETSSQNLTAIFLILFTNYLIYCYIS